MLNYNAHTIAIQVPKTDLLPGAERERDDRHLRERKPADDPRPARRRDGLDATGDWVQVSRLGNPLINEVVIPLGQKDLLERLRSRGRQPVRSSRYTSPELAGLVNLAVPGARRTRRRRVATISSPCCSRACRRLNFTGRRKADLLRLNTADRARRRSRNALGLLAGDFQGFPNGRRLADDVTDIELRAVACGYGPILAGAARALQPLAATTRDRTTVWTRTRTASFLSTFPYVAPPNQGYEHTGHK